VIVVSSHVDLDGDGGTMRVHLHMPGGTADTRRFPSLLLYSEIYQQTEPIQRSALRFASHGYLVAVPEVFHCHEPPGTVLGYDTEGTEKGNRYKYETPLATFESDARRALDLLRDHPRSTGALGSVGFCLGGHLAFRAALQPDVRATACFYPTDIHADTLGAGKTSDSRARAKEITGELLMIFGRQDPHVPLEGRREIQRVLSEANLTFSWHEVNAVHAFMRDIGPRYDPALAALGYQLALEMFDRVLKG
jgi:carboxymethylenebutenolidase